MLCLSCRNLRSVPTRTSTFNTCGFDWPRLMGTRREAFFDARSPQFVCDQRKQSTFQLLCEISRNFLCHLTDYEPPTDHSISYEHQIRTRDSRFCSSVSGEVRSHGRRSRWAANEGVFFFVLLIPFHLIGVVHQQSLCAFRVCGTMWINLNVVFIHSLIPTGKYRGSFWISDH